MKQVITAAQLEIIRKANEALAGTPDASRYYMRYEYRVKSAWKLGGYGVPQDEEDKPIKIVLDNIYIMIANDKRYILTDDVLALVGLENLQKHKFTSKVSAQRAERRKQDYHTSMEEALTYLRLAAEIVSSDEAEEKIKRTIQQIEKTYSKERKELYKQLKQEGKKMQTYKVVYTDDNFGSIEEYYYDGGIWKAEFKNGTLYRIERM